MQLHTNAYSTQSGNAVNVNAKSFADGMEKKLLTLLLLAGYAALAFSQIRPNEIRVARGSEDYPPKEMHVNGKLRGIHVEVIEAVAAKIGYTVVWNQLPWPRAQRCAELGECDAISFISPSPEREQWGLFLANNVLSQVEMRFMVHKDNADRISFNGNTPVFLNDKTLLSIIGYNYGPDIAKARKYEVKDLATMAAMVANKRYDVAVINAEDFAGLRLRDDLVLLDPPAWVSKAFLAFSRKANNSSELSAKFQASYVEFKKTKDYLAIVNHYKVTAK
ncbi:MAG: transporter substrate-binding domain-containing protein [Pseudomonadota bacterium]